MRVVAGCPVSNREWIISEWVYHLVMARDEAPGIDLSLYACGAEDDPTLVVFEEACLVNGIDFICRYTGEQRRNADVRDWIDSRYEQMARVRNFMLNDIRSIGPDFFLSIDSDVLIGPGVLSSMIDNMNDYDAVGSKTYLAMSPRRGSNPVCNVVNYAHLRNGQIRRRDQQGYFPVDVLMAIKMMSPKAYAVDYTPHRLGEDIGWSLACKEAGLTLGWDGRKVSKHCMKKEHLMTIDERVGW